jgi:hypothetical protein
MSARPDAGHTWAVTGLALHVAASGFGAMGVAGGEAGGDSGAAGNGPVPDSLGLFVVTESQTLSFNLKTQVKVGIACARRLRPSPSGTKLYV